VFFVLITSSPHKVMPRVVNRVECNGYSSRSDEDFEGSCLLVVSLYSCVLYECIE
jgi:hypothetical protein